MYEARDYREGLYEVTWYIEEDRSDSSPSVLF